MRRASARSSRGRWHRSTLAPRIHPLGHIRQYIYCMTSCDLSAWVPRGVDERAGAFARVVVQAADPATWARARSLLWAASRLCDCALAWGLAPEPDVLLQRALIERFILRGTPGWSGAAWRTARSNLLFLADRFFAWSPSRRRSPVSGPKRPDSEAQLARIWPWPTPSPLRHGAPGPRG